MQLLLYPFFTSINFWSKWSKVVQSGPKWSTKKWTRGPDRLKLNMHAEFRAFGGWSKWTSSWVVQWTKWTRMDQQWTSKSKKHNILIIIYIYYNSYSIYTGPKLYADHWTTLDQKLTNVNKVDSN